MNLAERVERHLRLCGKPQTVQEIARNLRVRTGAVRHLLVTDGRFIGPERDPERPRVYVYGLNPSQPVPARKGRPNRALRLHSVLKDGRWHSHAEIEQAVGRMYINNAASDLRVKHDIEVEYELIRGLPSYRLKPRESAPDSANAALLTRPAQETTPPGGTDGVQTQGELFTISQGAYGEAA